MDSSSGTGGASFLKLGLGSTRAMGMGRSYVSLAEGTDALTWNPAGLGLTQTREASYSYLSYVQGVTSPLYMAYAHPLGRTVIGANVAYMSVDGFDVRDSQGIPQNSGNTFVHDGFATISAARSFYYEKLFLGASLKAIHEDNAGAQKDNIVGDFGALYKPNSTYSFGFAYQDMGGAQSDVAKILRFGAAARMFDLMTVSVELSQPSDNGMQAGLGGEFILPEELLSVGQIAFRMGYYTSGNQGVILNSNRNALYPLVGAQGLSFGLGLFTSQAFGYGIGFDYAMVPMGALGTADHVTLKIKF